MVKISIVIATYNAGDVLERCLKSIIPELTEETELLIIDGGSRDNTMQTVQKYNKFISYSISEQDNGIYDAWNKGIMVSRGEWVMFLGADVQLKRNSLKELIHLMDNINPNVNFISSKAEYIDKDGNIISEIGSAYDKNIFQYQMNISHVGALHHKTLFDQSLFDTKYKICSDYDFLLERSDSIVSEFVNNALVVMQTGGVSFSCKAIAESFCIRQNKSKIGI